MNDFLQAMHFRHACKVFDENRQIPSDVFEEILESGRMSPSSMGFEPTRILVVRDKQLRQKLREACWGQIQITSASEVVVLKSLLSPMKPRSNYIRESLARRATTDEQINAFIERCEAFLADREAHGESLKSWVSKQAYIMASSMMNCAAFLGIDSCPIEGFGIDSVNKVLEIDTFKECVSLIIPFGYRIKPQQPRYRLNLNEIVEYK